MGQARSVSRPRRRFVRLADQSVKQRRVERREKTPEPSLCSRLVRFTTFDGDKSPAESGDESPHSKGFAVSRTASLLKPALMQIMENRFGLVAER